MKNLHACKMSSKQRNVNILNQSKQNEGFNKIYKILTWKCGQGILYDTWYHHK